MHTAYNMLGRLFASNGLLDWLAASTVGVLTLIALLLVRALARRRYHMMTVTPEPELLELPMHVISSTSLVFLVVIAFYVVLEILNTSPRMDVAANKALVIAGCWQTGIWASTAMLDWLHSKSRQQAADKASLGTFSILGIVARIMIWAFVVLLTLDNLGFNVTTLIAGLGIGGIAIALAVQNILGDLLASLSIVLDKPFVVGDFLVIGDFMGSVEYIGIKSTRLRSLSGEQIVMANADLLGSRVRNYGRMQERRVLFTIGVTYETPRAKLEMIAGAIRTIIESHPKTRFDRCHLAGFGAFSINFECVYYVLDPDYTLFMDFQHRINLEIHEMLEGLKVEFAYPTQKLFVARTAQ